MSEHRVTFLSRGYSGPACEAGECRAPTTDSVIDEPEYSGRVRVCENGHRQVIE